MNCNDHFFIDINKVIDIDEINIIKDDIAYLLFVINGRVFISRNISMSGEDLEPPFFRIESVNNSIHTYIDYRITEHDTITISDIVFEFLPCCSEKDMVYYNTEQLDFLKALIGILCGIAKYERCSNIIYTITSSTNDICRRALEHYDFNINSGNGEDNTIIKHIS